MVSIHPTSAQVSYTCLSNNRSVFLKLCYLLFTSSSITEQAKLIKCAVRLYSGVTGSILGPAKYLSYRFGHEISAAILSLLLIQVGQLSVTGESMGL